MSKENDGGGSDNPKSVGACARQYKSYESNYAIKLKNGKPFLHISNS